MIVLCGNRPEGRLRRFVGEPWEGLFYVVIDQKEGYLRGMPPYGKRGKIYCFANSLMGTHYGH